MIIILILLTFCLCGNGVAKTNSYSWEKINISDTIPQKPTINFTPQANFAIDLNSDGILDTISLGSSLPEQSLFNKISITLTGKSNTIFTARNAWTDVDSNFLSGNMNLLSTNKIFLHKEKQSAEILLFGILYGSGEREDFSIICIKGDAVTMVFDKSDKDMNIEVPIEIADLNQDGLTEFVFRNGYELYGEVDSLNADIGAYSPYLVYTIDDDFQINKPLTKKYNEEHFVFAGYSYSEKIKILFPRDPKKKPRIWK